MSRRGLVKKLETVMMVMMIMAFSGTWKASKLTNTWNFPRYNYLSFGRELHGRVSFCYMGLL